MTRKTETLAHIEASIKRWKTRLKRAVNMIDKLEKKQKRMLKLAADQPAVWASVKAEKVVVFEPEPVRPRAHAALADLGATLGPAIREAAEDAGIPAFLKRKPDAVVAEEIKAEQAEVKKAKAAGRIAKMKAKKSGETRKMPLTGKAALNYIKG